MRSSQDKYRITRAVRVLALLLAMLFVVPLVQMPEAFAAEDGMVRVNLTRLGSNETIAFQTTCDYYVDGKTSMRISSGSSATVSASGSTVYLTVNGVKTSMGSSLRLMRSTPGKTGIRFISPSMSNLFCGDLFLTASSSILTPVLNIYIEDYLYGVVGYEMSPSNSVEALKAQAVAARGYALAKMRSRQSKSYDVVDNTANQVFKGYNGSSSYASVVKAVDGTKGIVLYYGNSLAQCYYGSSNGGQTESTKNAWGSTLKYSVVMDDPYDLESTGTTKSANIRRDAKDLNASLKAALISGVEQYLTAMGVELEAGSVTIDGIDSVVPGDARFAQPSRLYQTLTFTVRATARNAAGQSQSGSVQVDVPTYGGLEKWYSLSINSGNNETVWVDEVDAGFIVSFRRNGHGIGMSQRGAQVMAKKYGKSVGEILEYYYPGTTPKQIALADMTADQKPSYTVIATAKARAAAALYASASTGAQCVAKLTEGAAVDVYAVSGSWAAVGSGSTLGFIQTSQLLGYVPAGQTVTSVSGEQYAVVVADNAALRELPNGDSTQMETLKKGEYVQFNAFTEKWVSVRTAAGATGYIARASLEVVSATPQPTVTPEPIVTPEGEMYARVINAQGAAVYVQASKDAGTVRVLEQGSFVRVLAYNSQWVNVMTYEQQMGYVLLTDLKVVDRAEVVITPSPSPTPAPTVQVITPEKDMYARATGDAKAYKMADPSSAVVTDLPKGTVVKVLAYTREWVQVQTTAGHTGFVQIGKLTVISAEEALSTPTPSPTPAPTPSGGKVVRLTGRNYVYVAPASSKVFRSYDRNSGVLTTLPYGTQVQIGAYNDDWAYVRYGKTIGYMLRSELTKTSPVSRSASHVIQAEFFAQASQSAKVYSRASTGGSVIGRLSKGMRVNVHAYNNAFAYISVGNNYGFVQIKYLRIVV